MYTLQQNLKVKINQMEAKFWDEKEKVFQKHFCGTYILSEVLKNEFLWQCDHGLVKNQENINVLGHTLMGAIICRIYVN